MEKDAAGFPQGLTNSGISRYLASRLPYLDPSSFERWLDPAEQRAEVIKALLCPLPDDWLVAHPVSRLVNNPKNEGTRCIEPAPG
jgi:putative SOS response-associated peptidase YedK